MKTRQLGRVFVTGADGFIGSHLVESLLADQHEVTALCVYNSLGSYGWLDRLPAKAKSRNLKLILGDVRDANHMREAVRDHQTVFHLASLIAIPYSYHAPQSYVDTNVSGTLNVAQAALAAKVERLIHTSTSEVYGTAQFVPITEMHPIQGQSPYSASKIGADMVIESFFRSFALPSVTLRPFNTYGPRQSLRAVIPTVISQALFGDGRIELGDLTPTRDFNYVSDTVAAFRAVAESSEQSLLGQTFNAGSGREISIGALVDLIGELTGSKLTVVTDENRFRPKLSEVNRLLASSEKLKMLTAWKPDTPLEKGLALTIEWMRASNEYSQSTGYRI